MGIKGNTSKKRRRTNNWELGKQRVDLDRLSSLHDDILVGIISCLPLSVAILSRSLSRRWRGLWKNVTSIHVSYDKHNRLSKFITRTDEIIRQCTSPVIHSFIVEFKSQAYISEDLFTTMSLWPRLFSDRNICELKLTLPGLQQTVSEPTLPRSIFQIHSLVSLELGSTFKLELPDNDNPFNLPNLKKLSLTISPFYGGWLEKLTEACPSLAELSLTCGRSYRGDYSMPDPKIRRPLILFFFRRVIRKERGLNLVINAPKLEYLAVHAEYPTAFYFVEDLVALREAKINVTNDDYYTTMKEILNMSTSKLDEAISNARVLTLDDFVLTDTSVMFRNATQLALNLKQSHNINTVLSFLELCPVLDVLSLKLMDISKDDKQWIIEKPGLAKTLSRVLKRIEIQFEWWHSTNPPEAFLKLLEHILSSAVKLEYFKFSANGDIDWMTESREMKFCKLLYQCPMISKACEVKFAGIYLKMSRKSGPKVWRRKNGEIIPFSCSTWVGFTFNDGYNVKETGIRTCDLPSQYFHLNRQAKISSV